MPSPRVLVIRPDFEATHQTAGLPGYPARDLFAEPMTPVRFDGTARVRRLSGRDPCSGGRPGGSFGWSIYLDAGAHDFFITHLGAVCVRVGDSVTPQTMLGTVGDPRQAAPRWSVPHVHVGRHTK